MTAEQFLHTLEDKGDDNVTHAMIEFAKHHVKQGGLLARNFNFKTMTDIEVFKKFMGWMQMEVSNWFDNEATLNEESSYLIPLKRVLEYEGE